MLEIIFNTSQFQTDLFIIENSRNLCYNSKVALVYACLSYLQLGSISCYEGNSNTASYGAASYERVTIRI